MRTMSRVVLFLGLMLLCCGTLKAQTSDVAVVIVENEDGQKEIRAEFSFYLDSDTNLNDDYDLDKELGKFLVQVIEEIYNNHSAVERAEISSNGDKKGLIESMSEHSLTFNFSICDNEVYENDSTHIKSVIRITVEDKNDVTN